MASRRLGRDLAGLRPDDRRRAYAAPPPDQHAAPEQPAAPGQPAASSPVA
ncbi:hypothetical protein Q3W71_25200 [Micromonospora sp. C28SCA-DRY-2]|nr:hypothetical protein [Micromonospora sp. C28SCA-DRY-2]MDO3704968.1 hypothetical protein [Micromonospora sp. C28SCA-DRY-2]